MMNPVQSKKRLFAKAFYTEFAIGPNHLDGWEATPIGDQVYKIKRVNGTEIVVAIGQEIPNVGLVSINNENNLSVGKHTVVIGENVVKQWTAKTKQSKKEFLIKNPDNKTFNVEIGQNITNLGKVNGLDQYGNLSVGDKSIAMLSKVRELKLLVYQDRHEKFTSGYKCHFNLIKPGSASNLKDGIPGVFFPAYGNRPAKFCEVVNGVAFSTAVFFPGKSKEFSIGHIRTLETAFNERAIYEKLLEIKKESESIGVNPDDNFEYAEYNEKMKDIKNHWETNVFNVSEGKSAFGIIEKPKENQLSR